MLAEIEARRGGYRLLCIPGGTFTMGSPEREPGRTNAEGPMHSVEIGDFGIGRFPVTNAAYRMFLDDCDTAEPPDFWEDEDFNSPRQPVVGVSFDDAMKYCEWAGLRLPSEAEWEYACRAGTTERYHCGNRKKDLERVAWYSLGAGRRLHCVGEKAPNAFGLYDMHGNVWEWCADEWHDSYVGAPADASPWTDAAAVEERVLRGGSWFGNTADYLRSATRLSGIASFGDFNIGFRCAL